MMKELTAADGHELDCWIARADGESRGGIVILQEIFGVTDQLKGAAQRYAALGYDVAIPALFDRQKKGTVVPFDQGPKGAELMNSTDPDKTLLDIDAAVKSLAADGSKVGVIGFCWGGGLAIRAAQDLNISAAVAFYGTRLPRYFNKPIKAPVLGHFGEADGHVPPDMLEAAKAQWPEMVVYMYEAGHAFANDARPDFYVADAAEAAHQRTIDFLRQHIG